MKVSIITSCFNRQNTIREAIESVLAQDYPNIEYIIVDGASNDNSLKIVNEYRIILILLYQNQIKECMKLLIKE